MEVKDALRKSSKGQMMTLLMVVIFLLMLAELFAFVLLSVGTDSISQSMALSSSSSNYGSLARESAASFGQASAARALSTLVNYSSTPALRKGNFITNFSLYFSNLMINGTLPNDTSGYPARAMGPLTFKNYNLLLSGQAGLSAQNVNVNFTAPVVFQTDPYSIHVSYIERLTFNSSGSSYRYAIPVNVSVSLNNTPDLFYAQQGIFRPIKPAAFGNLSSVVGSAYAAAGNSIGYAYGTVYSVPSNTATSATCPLPVPAAFNAVGMGQYLIISTYNAQNIGSCINNFGGLVTYVPPSALPTVPYLVYASSTNALQSMPSGMHVLLNGPGMDVLNIENLRNAVMNAYYLPSQFAPSYTDRASANLLAKSPNGLLTFSNYNTQAAFLNGASSYLSGSGHSAYPVA
ncbi:Uncharacterised protein [uncultured archaeon]|nr:Uncharacterised protein [uncultured archaeon]